ncbi:MAG TPA: succinate dehydrogenase/fumarate reductase iron-sulfur subunit [Bryobacteraceae bacterium]|nr:succinate dehydrogenase/fumarate reductase iron-sulfur subunit [Bryobacteraceae bacterium]
MTASVIRPGTRTYEVRVTKSAEIRSYPVTLGDRMTVLDALFQIQAELDSSIGFRCACRVGMCGTCAMYINRVPRLACKTRPSQLDSTRITLAPLPNLPVIQDLVVSLQPFFEQWKRIRPALRGSGSDQLATLPPDPETSRKRDCITCGICYAACGIKATHADYLGPAAINKAFLRIKDPRDGAHRERLQVLNDEWSGVWRCHTQFNCTVACPKQIDLTDTIARLKRALLTS